MKQRIDLRFRPSLIIFVGEVGRQVRLQFERIVRVTELDPVLHQSIALLQVRQDAEPVQVFRPGKNGIGGTQEATAEGQLEDLIDLTLRDVQANRRVQEIIDAGYPIPNTRTQIYIVGRANSSRVSHVLRAVNAQLDKSQFNTLTCYILIARPKMPEDTGPLPDLNLPLHGLEDNEDEDEGFPTFNMLAPAPDPIVEESDDEEDGSFVEREQANFCYLYEDMQPYPVPTFVSEDESYHAAAEALFALIATGITPEPVFEQQMRLISPLTDPALLRREQERYLKDRDQREGRLVDDVVELTARQPATHHAGRDGIDRFIGTGEPFESMPRAYENVGSLSTSLVIFPRTAILEYCSARLGVVLTSQWLRDLDEYVLPSSVREKLQKSAQTHVRRIESWIRDGAERPYASGYRAEDRDSKIKLGPNLRILTGTEVLSDRREASQSERVLNEQKRTYRRHQTRTADLFKLFWTEEIEHEYRRLKRRKDSWTKLVYQQEGKAVEAFKQWDKAAAEAWDLLGERIAIEVKDTIDRLWAGDDSGFEQAMAYVDGLDDLLGVLADRMSRWRETHERDYREVMDHFEELATGDWIVPEDATSIIGGPGNQGPAQAVPTMGDRGVASNASNSSAANGIIGGSSQSATPAYQHLPPREERLARRLEQRVLWLQARVPSILTQVTISVPCVIALILAAFVLIPVTPIWGSLTLLAALILVGGVHSLFHWRYLKKVNEAKEDLLNFYRHYYAHRCQEREDKLRLLVIGPLRRKVQAIRDRLDGIRAFIDGIRTTLDTQAVSIVRDLFDGPGGVRDVYVAHGERLQRERKNTLADFEGQLAKQRIKEPVQPWHSSSQEMKRHLIDLFRNMSESILEMNEEEAGRYIYQFAEGVAQDYLKGAFVDIQDALDQPDVWSEALSRASNPLYRARVGIRDPQMLFVCGREQDIIRGERATLNRNRRSRMEHAHAVYISDQHAWILVAAFFRGGLPEAFNPDLLFPARPTGRTRRSSTKQGFVGTVAPEDSASGAIPVNEDDEDATGTL